MKMLLFIAPILTLHHGPSGGGIDPGRQTGRGRLFLGAAGANCANGQSDTSTRMISLER